MRPRCRSRPGPGAQGPAELRDLRDRARRETAQDLGYELAAFLRAGVVDGAQLLVGLPGDGHFVVRVPGFELLLQPRDLFLRQGLDALLEGAADAVERIILLSPVPERVLLNAPADVIDRARSKFHGIKRVIPTSE